MCVCAEWGAVKTASDFDRLTHAWFTPFICIYRHMHVHRFLSATLNYSGSILITVSGLRAERRAEQLPRVSPISPLAFIGLICVSGAYVNTYVALRKDQQGPNVFTIICKNYSGLLQETENVLLAAEVIV